jgi:hypothetical protein
MNINKMKKLEEENRKLMEELKKCEVLMMKNKNKIK